MEKELTSIKYKSFGKVKVKSSKRELTDIDKLQTKKVSVYENRDAYNEDDFEDVVKIIDNEISAALLTNQRKVLEAELTLLRSAKLNKGNSAAIFKLKDSILGPKKIGQQAASLIDFRSGIELTNPKDIREASLQYCVQLLSNREPKAAFKKEVECKALMHQSRMVESIQNDVHNNLSVQMFDETLKALSVRDGKYEFIMNGGPALKAALFSVCQSVWKTEIFPENWQKTTLIQLYKGKGPRNDLENMRHIHIKNEFSKFFGHLVVTAVKPHLFKNLSKHLK